MFVILEEHSDEESWSYTILSNGRGGNFWPSSSAESWVGSVGRQSRLGIGSEIYFFILNIAFIFPQASFPNKAMEATNAVSAAMIKIVVVPTICPFDRSKNGSTATTAQGTNEKISNI